MKSCKGLNICILMLNSPNIAEYAHLASMVNYIYASKHGYNFFVHRCPRPNDLSKDWMWDMKNEKNEYLLVWSKPTIVRQYLKYFDYVMFIDSDAVFIDHNKTIEDFINQYMTPDVHVLWSEDCLDKNYCYDKNTGNAGVMLFRNSQKTMEILDAWYSAPENGLCKEWKYNHPREQKCLNILTKVYPSEIRLLNYNAMNGKDGDWVRHYMGTPRDERVNNIKEMLCALFSPYCSGQKNQLVEGFHDGNASTCPLASKSNILIMGILLILLIMLAVLLRTLV